MMNQNKIILGTVQFGLDYGIYNLTGKPSEKQVLEILNYAGLHGIKILDTADAYGNASDILGKYHSGHSDTFLINTKFKHGELSISGQLEVSLNKLHTSQINVYFYHNFNDFIAYPAIRDELIKLKYEGKILKSGISVYDNEELKTAIDSDVIDVIQVPFNLLDNRFQRGHLLMLAKKKGKEIQVRSVFLQGLFFRPIETIPAGLAVLKPYLLKIHELSENNHIPVEMLALLYALQQPEIDNVIIGVDNMEQLIKNLHFAQQSLSQETIYNINQIAVRETGLLYPKNWN
jgi:uncharacterized protein